ncbi:MULTISPECIES: F0F1 ATP synthase subunit delta [Sporosarcina]|uniref:F0F1 ATP synthase subunit delta n=1 Tax=Sporosarcina TaxID=1569 RepID=UPI00058E50FA|nr:MULTISPECIES: F0F1 ATP synthase subunit delta [Sporosarcina]WJY26505.1 F0F1 ATP synthase subunit delta [Sporosarcina sp. 0.2-SM1T-5]
MSRSIVSERYAAGLFKAAMAQGALKEVHTDVRELQKALETGRGFMELMSLPQVSLEKKHSLIASVMPGAHQLLLNALNVMLDADRMEELPSVLEEFNELANDAAGIAEATVYATRELTEQEQTRISSAFAARVGKQSLHLTTIIDPSLIGGIRLQIGNRIFDSSLSTKLASLQRTLIG